MKGKGLWFLISDLAVLAVLILVIWFGVKRDLEETEQAQKAEGLLTVYDENGEVYFQYSGEISIMGDGGELEIELRLPTSLCGCFDEEGRRKE